MHAPPDLTHAHLSHMETMLEQLNERIARLARLLDISLDAEATRLKILDGSLALPPDWHPSDSGPAKRRRHEWVELRGLMVLRVHMMKGMLDELGLEPTFQIAQLVHENMVQEGFQPGSDGFEMLQRLQDEHDRRLQADGPGQPVSSAS